MSGQSRCWGTRSAAYKQRTHRLVEGGENVFGGNQTTSPRFDNSCHVRIGAIGTLLLTKPFDLRTYAFGNTCSARPHRSPQMGFAEVCDLIVVYLNTIAMHYNTNMH